MRDASADPRVVGAWYDAWPDSNIGVATGLQSRLVVLDVDVKDDPSKDGRLALAALEGKHGALPQTLIARTGSGGFHLFFAYPEDGQRVKNSVGRVAPGLDVRADGGYVVVPPSTHVSGGRYEWLNDEYPAEIPQWLLDLFRRAGARNKKPGEVGIAAVFKAGGRNDALTSFAGTLRRRGLNADEIAKHLAILNEERCRPPLERDEVEAIARSIGRYEPSQTDPALAAASATSGEPWQERLTKSKITGAPLASLANAVLAVANHDEIAGVFRWNERADTVWLMREPSWNVARGPQIFAPRAWTEADVLELTCFLSELWATNFTSQVVAQAVETVARRDAFDPVREYLEGLTWDGVSRLSSWLSTYCGAGVSDHVTTAGARWLISAVARTLEPGCKADHVLILEGAQGAGKSTVAEILAVRPEWYTDDLHDIGGRSAAEQIQGKWLVELAELAATRKAEAEVIKAFVSRREDNYRAPYARVAVSRKRRCVFFGTTNPGAYLVDPTGARRFWVVKVSEIDTEGLRLVRDQLWAEAVVAYKAGVQWHPTRDEGRAHEEAALAATAEDVLLSQVEDFVQDRTLVTVRQIAIEALRVEPRDVDRYARKISDALRRCGWVRGRRVRLGGGSVSPLAWHPEGRPPSAEELESLASRRTVLRVVKLSCTSTRSVVQSNHAAALATATGGIVWGRRRSKHRERICFWLTLTS